MKRNEAAIARDKRSSIVLCTNAQHIKIRSIVWDCMMNVFVVRLFFAFIGWMTSNWMFIHQKDNGTTHTYAHARTLTKINKLSVRLLHPFIQFSFLVCVGCHVSMYTLLCTMSVLYGQITAVLQIKFHIIYSKSIYGEMQWAGCIANGKENRFLSIYHFIK